MSVSLAGPPPGVVLVDAEPTHLPAITAIYEHHVLHGTATFEITPPSLDEMTGRWRTVRADGLPYLVALEGPTVVGYAYGAPYRRRAAYAYTVEDSLYLAPEATGRGIGRALLSELIQRCEALGLRQMVAVIAGADNTASLSVHRACGFHDAGRFEAAGYKHGQWIDILFMQRALGPGSSEAPDTKKGP